MTAPFPVGLRRAAYRFGYPAFTVWRLVRWLAGSRQRGAKCVLTNANEVLLVRHTYGDRERWDLPGGLVRGGEAATDAISRELMEELGVTPAALSPLGKFSIRVNGRFDDVHLFAGELEDRQLSADGAEIAEVGWFARETLPGGLHERVRTEIEELLRDG